MRRRTFIQSTVAAAAAISLPRREAFATAFHVVPRRPQEIEAVTGDGQRVVLTSQAIADLRARLRGKSCSRGTKATTRPG
jgi:hypothetical protein